MRIKFDRTPEGSCRRFGRDGFFAEHDAMDAYRPGDVLNLLLAHVFK